MKDMNHIDSYQAYLPVQYYPNITFIRQKWHWCCVWQRATPGSHVQIKPLVCSIGYPCSSWLFCFTFYTQTKPLIQLPIKCKTVLPLKVMSTWTNVPWYICDKESYLSWLTYINVAFPYMQQTYFHLIISELIIFPQAFKNLFEVEVLLKCWNRGNIFH